MVRIPNEDGEEEDRRMNPDSSPGIYITAPVEAQCILISCNQMIKEEDNTKNTNVNALNRVAFMNHRAQSFQNLSPISQMT